MQRTPDFGDLDRLSTTLLPGFEKKKMASASSSSGGAWDELKIQMKDLRALLHSSSLIERRIKCEVKRILNTTISNYEDPHRYENSNTVLEILSGRGISPLEAAFMWMGAWRPSAAISLVFSVMGLKNQGLNLNITDPGTLGGSVPALSEEQLSQLQTFRDLTSQAEKDLTEELATVQMMLADQDVVTDLLKDDEGAEGSSSSSSKLKETLHSKISSLRDVLKRADQLRIKTLLELHSVLAPIQAAQCSIVAFEVAFAMRSLNSATPPTTSCPRK
ncbi:hypothetical protein SELMODRAFT_416825 [Selaginella moellendorffii]|uniref:DOG1 domain-containing protein n=1 Tax=Selaginella moellendorffii TaxID=88036 RepID=D8S0I7_SELML|nr:hypothetical protein SELMODRAFT_416825 [Selaginella moellendorffii]